MVATSNPAGLVHLDDRKDLGLTNFSPRREYTVSGAFSPLFPPFPGDTVESRSETFFIPNFGWKRSIDDHSAVGVAVYGNGGMNTDWAVEDTILGRHRRRDGCCPGCGATLARVMWPPSASTAPAADEPSLLEPRDRDSAGRGH
jgi:hypothetical protein